MAEHIYYYITHTSPELKTVWDFVNDINSAASKYIGNEEGFLNITNDYGTTNRQVLFNAYTQLERISNEMTLARDLPLKIGVRFAIPVDKVDRNGLLTQGLQIVSNDDVAFKAAALAELEADAGYVVINKPIEGQIQKGTLKQIVPECTVWIWCRALSGKYDGDEMKGQIFDVTPFVQSISTNMSKNGGSFSLSLSPIVCEQVTDGTWQIKSGSVIQYQPGSKFTSLAGQGYAAQGSLYDENMRRTQFLFQNIISTNDLVFIRFETLKMEQKDRYNNSDGNLYVDKNQIPGKIYDMIGLVDIETSTITPSSTDVSITINGRDLSKLIIEDGSYFYALEFASQSKFGFASSASTKSGLFQRLLSEGQLLYFNLWYNTSIEKAIAFVLNQLSNIKIVPDDLFSGYDTRRTKSERNKTFKLKEADAYKGKPKDAVLQTYKTNAINAIRKLRKSLGLTYFLPGVNISAEQEIFNDLMNFLQTIRDKKLRIVDGNKTIGWQGFTWLNPKGLPEVLQKSTLPTYFENKLYRKQLLVIGKPIPYSALYFDVINNIDSYLDVVNSSGQYSEQYEEKLASGIWQIIKMVVDKGVVDRRIVDGSISTIQGSLINYFRKICQSPFVEFFGDTYGDTYNFITRKPPTDQISLISMIEGKMQTESGKVTFEQSPIVEVEDYDVLNESLSFDDSMVYSWYHLNIKHSIGGAAGSFQYFYLPALLFEEYSEIWGSRPMDIMSNYIPYIPLDSKTPGEQVMDIAHKQAIHDLKFIVDSNMANPFTRRGTIVLNGDRRLKVGNFIRYKPTGEIFQIDAVQQSCKIGENSIDRTTVIQVSRGMVEQLIYGIPYWNSKNQEVDHISYFNIINTKLNLKYSTRTVLETVTVQDGYQMVAELPINLNTKYPQGSLAELQKANFVLEEVGTRSIVKNKGLEKLSKLHPNVQKAFVQFINAINNTTMNGAPILVEITSGVRSKQEQEVEFRKNSLNAKPGKSPHEAENGGLAIDINLIYRSPGRVFAKYIKKQDTKAMWKSTTVPQIAKELGLLWGGDAFAGYFDPVHFQVIPQPNSLAKRPLFKQVTRTRNVSELDGTAVFSNFKVNKHVFNFFMRGEQFASKYNPSQINRTIYKQEVKAALI